MMMMMMNYLTSFGASLGAYDVLHALCAAIRLASKPTTATSSSVGAPTN
jgi:hypothetical protein